MKAAVNQIYCVIDTSNVSHLPQFICKAPQSNLCVHGSIFSHPTLQMNKNQTKNIDVL